VKHDVTIAAPLNLPATMPEHASELYSKNITALLDLLIKAGQIHAVDQAHVHVELPVDLTEVVNRHDVRFLQAPRGARRRADNHNRTPIAGIDHR
ncbi:hypothetical protein ACNJT3_21320, partial [Mycobacterium tuberculosis]